MPHLVDPAVNPKRLSGQQPDIWAGELRLRRWTSEDAPQLVAAYADPEITRWNLRTLDSPDEAIKLISTWNKGWRRSESASWAVAQADDQATVLGQVGFRSLFLADGMAEISYWVAPAWRRRGIATRATEALAEWALNGLGLERLELVHSLGNGPSCQVARAAGFEVEGIKRRLQLHADGWHDMHLHSRLRQPQHRNLGTASC
jgi:RimJ/RimL family protein N-acetyltransferase